MPFTCVCCLFCFPQALNPEKHNPQFPLQRLSMSTKDLYIFFVKYTFILDHFSTPRQKTRALSCCFEQVVRKGQAALSHLSGFFHLAWGSVVLTVWRLKHPLSFPAPVVAFPKRVQIWIVFSTPFGADYREPAFQWPPRFMVVSGTS